MTEGILKENTITPRVTFYICNYSSVRKGPTSINGNTVQLAKNASEFQPSDATVEIQRHCPLGRSFEPFPVPYGLTRVVPLKGINPSWPRWRPVSKHQMQARNGGGKKVCGRGVDYTLTPPIMKPKAAAMIVKNTLSRRDATIIQTCGGHRDVTSYFFWWSNAPGQIAFDEYRFNFLLFSLSTRQSCLTLNPKP